MWTEMTVACMTCREPVVVYRQDKKEIYERKVNNNNKVNNTTN